MERQYLIAGNPPTEIEESQEIVQLPQKRLYQKVRMAQIGGVL